MLLEMHPLIFVSLSPSRNFFWCAEKSEKYEIPATSFMRCQVQVAGSTSTYCRIRHGVTQEKKDFLKSCHLPLVPTHNISLSLSHRFSESSCSDICFKIHDCAIIIYSNHVHPPLSSSSACLLLVTAVMSTAFITQLICGQRTAMNPST
jgi:hypothetical protein